MDGFQKSAAIIVCAICAAFAVMAFASDGCQQTASVTCPDGRSYSTQEWGGEPDLSLEESEEFCEKGEPVR